MTDGARNSAWAPLRHADYRSFWLAGLFSNTGVWMQNVGAAWLMASLTSSPLLIASVQFATSLPVFLLGLPAGYLADRYDRRRILLLTFGWTLSIDLLLSLSTMAGSISVSALLLATLMLGSGAALASPAVQSIVVDLVPRSLLQPAIMLGGISFNTARALGPALAGAIIAGFGAGEVFVASSVCFAAMLLAAARLQLPARPRSALPAERLLGGMRAGLRYARHSPGVLAALVRTALFGLSAAALWALLPLLAKHSGASGAGGFGALVTCLGAGAVSSAALAPVLAKRYDADQVSHAAALLFAATMLVASQLRFAPLLYLSMVLAGVAWALCLNTIYAEMQTVLPNWVRARCLALYLMLLQGAMAAGSLLWGSIAQAWGLGGAFAAAAAAMLSGSLYARWRHRLFHGEDVHVTSAEPLIGLRAAAELAPDDGPVAIEIEYLIDVGCSVAFISASAAIGRIRRRDGAMFWRLYRDLESAGCYRERFIVDDWAEYLRSRSRGTQADRLAEAAFRGFHQPAEPPRVRHSIAER